MKSIFTCIVLMTATLTVAAGALSNNYLAKTIVPPILQDEIVQAVYQKYPCLTSFGEVYTTEKVDLNDQVRDYFYSTTFKVMATNGNEPPHALFINVESALWAIHGITTEIGAITTTQGDGICL